MTCSTLSTLFRTHVSEPKDEAEGLEEASSDMQYLVKVVPRGRSKSKGWSRGFCRSRLLAEGIDLAILSSPWNASGTPDVFVPEASSIPAAGRQIRTPLPLQRLQRHHACAAHLCGHEYRVNESLMLQHDKPGHLVAQEERSWVGWTMSEERAMHKPRIGRFRQPSLRGCTGCRSRRRGGWMGCTGWPHDICIWLAHLMRHSYSSTCALTMAAGLGLLACG